ncbi:putative quinol monooxygenase [Alteromonas gracilis]|uniref:putative quinol monooxygenase n=1 Tax=Alteromonas gracilis TaxID=1479524 RepID=UPI002FE2902C
MIEFSVIVFSRPNQQERLLQSLTVLVQASRKEPGAVMYDLHSSDDGLFVITEKWESQAALDAHEEAVHFADFQEKAKDLVEKVLRLPLIAI